MAWVNLGSALMQRSREGTQADEYYDRAESAFRQALQVSPDHAEATVGLAWIYSSRHQFDQGIEWAQKAIRLDAANQDAYALLGDAAVELGNYQEALEHYQKCLDLGPNLASYSRAAHLLFITGDSSKARLLMQKAIDAGGPYAENTAWCQAQLAMMLFETGALIAADQQLEQGLQIAQNNRHLLAAMARVKTAKKEYEAAIACCHKALAVARDHDVLVLLGDLYALSGKDKAAEEQFRQVLELQGGHDHGNGEVHAHTSDHGNALLAKFLADHDRNLDEALLQAEKAFKQYKNVFVTDTLAWCYYKEGRYKEASDTIAAALRLGTPKAEILFHAGMIHTKLGDRPTAQKYLYQALSLNPHFHATQAELAANTIKELSARNDP
jgi:tetratricopeptide (TPR) repeat protein